MPNDRLLKRIWWLTRLALVLASLAHDLLMASVTLAAPVAPAESTAHGHDLAPHAIGVDASRPAIGPTPQHPSDCGTTGTAVPYAGNRLDVSGPGMPAIVACDLSALAHASANGWSEPLWPPGATRAFFQVYRI